MDAYKPTQSGTIPFGAYQTSYKLFGTLPTTDTSGHRPLIALHGGPSVSHIYLLPLSKLWETHKIPVILYDQIGSGESTHLPEKGVDFWTIDLFLSELENLLSYLKVEEYDLLGHSWGGILAQEWAARQPKGLKHLVLTDSFPSMQLWIENTNRQIGELPKEAQEAIEKHEREGTPDAPEYRAAVGMYYSKHLCTMQPWPEVLGASFAQVIKDPTVPTALLGPAAFNITGPLKSWSIIDRLPLIQVPTLVTYGKEDQAGPLVQRPYVEKGGIERVTEKMWEGSSHVPWIEEGDAYLEYLGDWLNQE